MPSMYRYKRYLSIMGHFLPKTTPLPCEPSNHLTICADHIHFCLEEKCIAFATRNIKAIRQNCPLYDFALNYLKPKKCFNFLSEGSS